MTGADWERLAQRLAQEPAMARAAMARHAGPGLARLANVGLQHRIAAESAAATAILWVAGRIEGGWRPAAGELQRDLELATLQAAAQAHARTREVEPAGPAGGLPGSFALGPTEIAVAAGIVLLELPLDVVADGLRMSPSSAQRALHGALSAAGSRGALRHWLHARHAPVTFEVGDEALQHAAAPPDRSSRRLVTAGAGLAVAAMALLVLSLPAPASTPSPTPDALSAKASPDAADTAVALELGDCGVRPANAELAYGGWLTAGLLGGQAAHDPGQPLYALVTRDPVRTRGGPQYQASRVACVLGRDGDVEVVPLADDWEAPAVIDGCPASPFQWFAGYAEIGGPGAFVLLPLLGTSWWADDPSVRILARLDPGPDHGALVTAVARPLGNGEPVTISVDSPPTPDGREPSSAHYVWLEEVEFSRAGCWVVSLQIDGEEVGTAILPVSRHPG